jgi:hypothetical protein
MEVCVYGFRFYGLGLRVYRFRVYGLGFSVYDSGLRD